MSSSSNYKKEFSFPQPRRALLSCLNIIEAKAGHEHIESRESKTGFRDKTHEEGPSNVTELIMY